MKIGPALVMTPDLDAALDFYGDILGLTLSRRSPDQLVFEDDGKTLHIFRSGRSASESRHGDDAASVITFEVESLEDEIARLRARGVTFLHEKPASNEFAGLTYAAFVAPGGNIHELVERTRR